MVSLLLAVPVGLVILYVFNWYLCYVRNLKLAKASGIPYVVVPVFLYNRFWLFTHPLWLKIARRVLPPAYLTWIDFCNPNWPWEYKYEPFKRLGTDTFLTASPAGLSLWTADPSVISQITTRRNDFPKPTQIYASLDAYGKNVVSTEGAEWRHHRKSTSPPFTEKNNQLVWAETLDQTQAMVASWVGEDGKGNKTIDRIMDDTMRLSLHVISRAGFGRKMEWPTSEAAETTTNGDINHSKIKNESKDIDAGHTMSYTYALHCLLDNIILIMLMPKSLLSWSLPISFLRHLQSRLTTPAERLPIPIVRKSYDAYTEWGDYMRGMVAAKKAALRRSITSSNSMDILGQLVKGQVMAEEVKNSPPPLTDSEILGNAFVIILAGHETTANSIHFALIYLALHTSFQRRLQKDIDGIFQGRPVSEWDYDRDLPGLFGGMTGAVLNEELRLVPAVVSIPKSTYNVPDQNLMVNGKKCTMPGGQLINLLVGSVHRNPKAWPHGPPTNPSKPAHPFSNLDNDLEEFKPERWVLNEHENVDSGNVDSSNANGHYMPKENVEGDDLGVNVAPDTANSLYRPPKGAYIPFSDGHRACLGRRFAQIEVLACLAVIFSKYSVELAVDKYASDVEVERMGDTEKAQVWEKAADDAQHLLNFGCSVIISLQMRKGHVSLRFVPRREERFNVNT